MWLEILRNMYVIGYDEKLYKEYCLYGGKWIILSMTYFFLTCKKEVANKKRFAYNTRTHTNTYKDVKLIESEYGQTCQTLIIPKGMLSANAFSFQRKTKNGSRNDSSTKYEKKKKIKFNQKVL